MRTHKSHLLIRYDCLGCQHHYFVEYIYDGRNDYTCPHCGKKQLNVGKSLATDVVFEEESIEEWESASFKLRTLIHYLGVHYPDGHGEDVFHALEEAIYGGKDIDRIFYYEDETLKQLLLDVMNEVEEIKKG